MTVKRKNLQQKALTAFALTVLALILLANYAMAPAQNTAEFGEINFVYDGDTYRVKTSAGKLKTVRIIGADSPEVQSPYRDEQCFGPEASEFARENFLGKRVELVKDPFTKDKDQYGRFLRYLKLETGDYISQILINEGLARVYLPANFEEKENFLELEKEAQNQNLGIWKHCPVEQL